MAFELPFGIKVLNAIPSDYYKGPWSSTTQALSVTLGTRYTGQTVTIVDPTLGLGAQDWWFQSGTTDNALILKSNNSASSIVVNNGLIKNSDGSISFGGSLINDTLITGNYNLELGGINNQINNFNVYGKTSLNNRYGGFNIGGVGFDDVVSTLAIQTDGKLLVGGIFYGYNGLSCSNKLVRLNADGIIDNTFNSGGTGFDNDVLAIVIQSDNKILVGGFFISYNGLSCSNKLVRLNADGTIDNTFNSGGTGFNDAISFVTIQSDGKLLVGGGFIRYNGITCSNNLVRLNADGTIDNTFNSGGTGFDNNAGFSNVVSFVTIQSDGKLLVGGGFIRYNGITCSNNLVRLNADGTIDNTFNSGGTGFDNNGGVNFVTIQSDGKLLVGGNFSTYNTVSKTNLIRLNSNGTIDNTFNSGGSNFDGLVAGILIQSDGKLLVNGGFTTYNGISKVGLVRLNADGTIDNTFNSGATGFNNAIIDILAIGFQLDGKILVGGQFTIYNGISKASLIRLNADGSIDSVIDNKVLFNGTGVLRYAAKYHNQFTLRSIPDVEFVLNAISATTYSGNTGIISSSYSATTGTVTSGDTFQIAISKIDGNSLTKVTIAPVNNPLLTSSSNSVTWSITNPFNNSDIITSVQEVSTGQVVNLGFPTITNSTITYQFYSTTNVTASKFRAIIMGVYISGTNLLSYYSDGSGNIYVNENGNTYIL